MQQIAYLVLHDDKLGQDFACDSAEHLFYEAIGLLVRHAQ